jgi:hypothetical protein
MEARSSTRVPFGVVFENLGEPTHVSWLRLIDGRLGRRCTRGLNGGPRRLLALSASDQHRVRTHGGKYGEKLAPVAGDGALLTIKTTFGIKAKRVQVARET